MEWWLVQYYHDEVWDADIYSTTGYQKSGPFGIEPIDSLDEQPYYTLYPDHGPS